MAAKSAKTVKAVKAEKGSSDKTKRKRTMSISENKEPQHVAVQGEIGGQIERLYQFANQIENDARDLAELITPVLDRRPEEQLVSVEEVEDLPLMNSSIGDQIQTVNSHLENISEFLQSIRNRVAL